MFKLFVLFLLNYIGSNKPRVQMTQDQSPVLAPYPYPSWPVIVPSTALQGFPSYSPLVMPCPECPFCTGAL